MIAYSYIVCACTINERQDNSSVSQGGQQHAYFDLCGWSTQQQLLQPCMHLSTPEAKSAASAAAHESRKVNSFKWAQA